MSLERQINPTSYAQDGQLLRRYVEKGDTAAFDRLMQRHWNLVYRTCLRELQDPELAQDATQTVFLLLMRKAASLRRADALVAWLFQAARLTSRDACKQEMRRRQREERAAEETRRRQMEQDEQERKSLWNQTQPLLNQALSTLPANDRKALLLRFFEGLSFQETGTALGLTEDAVRMRIRRALEKLRRRLAKAGILLTAATLTALLTEHEATATVALSAARDVISLLHSPGHLSTIERVGRTMNWLKWKSAVLFTLGVVVLLGTVGLLRTEAALQTASERAAKTLAHAQEQAALAIRNGASAIPSTQMPEPFTLVYAMTERDVSTPEMLAKRLKNLRASYDTMVHDGQMTQEQADFNYRTVAEGMQNAPREERWDVMVSARDGKLFYRSDDPTQPTRTRLYVFDGVSSMIYTEMNAQATVTSGYALWHVNFPLPGLGLPGVPLLRAAGGATTPLPPLHGDALQTVQGEVPAISQMHGVSQTPEVVYGPGKVQVRMVEGMPQVTQVDVSLPNLNNRLIQRWEYAQHRLFQGVWMAAHLRRTTFQDGQPDRVDDFQLQNASSVPLDVASFRFETWLPKATRIDWFVENKNLHFRFDPAKGNLDDQAVQPQTTKP
ncbi:MAG TPA: sigma-70 family RNA polymerase sigma factor [Chthonomonadaceae bacterium]|nr:sigma-70 family RNA polymerase sigma factor [Chthonomonadaceae bacterium]